MHSKIRESDVNTESNTVFNIIHSPDVCEQNNDLAMFCSVWPVGRGSPFERDSRLDRVVQRQ
jgi:hypothetical protein